MGFPEQVRAGIDLALAADRAGLLSPDGLDRVLRYYDAEGARDPAAPREILARLGGLSDAELDRLAGGGGGPDPGLPEGGRFNDRLTFLAAVGEGGMGAVYRAHDRVLRREVAVKVVRAERLAGRDPDRVRARFEREARAMARVQHPACVRIYDAGVSRDGQPFLVMEWVPGESLQGRLHRAGPLEPEQAARWGQALAEALQACHDVGIVHRDVKPANVLLDAGDAPRLTDFGVALDDQARTRLTAESAAVGTLAYMPPEQAGGERADPRSDVYGLGASLYEALAGRPVFDASRPTVLLRQIFESEPTPLRSHRPEVPADLETVVHKCLAKRPVERYATAQALALDLARVLAGEPVTARPVTAWDRLRRRLVRRRKPILAGLAAAVVALAGGLGWRAIDAARDRRAALAAIEGAADEPDLDAAEERLLPLLGHAEREVAERARAALDGVRGRRALAEARAGIEAIGAARAREAELRAELAELEGATEWLTSVEDSPRKQRRFELAAAIEEAERAADGAMMRVAQALARAAVDLEGAQVDALRARLLLERGRRRLAQGQVDRAEAAFAEAYDLDARSGSALAADLTPARLRIAPTPAAEYVVSRYAFDPRRGRQRPHEAARGRTPAELELATGDYLLELRAPGCMPTRLPLALRRGQARVVDLGLPGRAPLGPLVGEVAFVASGRARLGEELEVSRPAGPCFMKRTEVTLEEWRSFLVNACPGPEFVPGRFADPTGALEDATYRRWPVFDVSWDEARAYLRWFASEVELMGLPWAARLPTPGEFHRAVRGELRWPYPWGRRLDESFFRQGNVERGVAPTVGCVPADWSPFGLWDLCGGVAEFAAARHGELVTIVGASSEDLRSDVASKVTGAQLTWPDAAFTSVGLRWVLADEPALREEEPPLRVHPPAALGRATASIRAGPEVPDRWLRRAEVRLAAGDTWGALLDCRQALLLDPDHVRALMTRAEVQYRRDEDAAAAADATRAIELAPQRALPWLVRGKIRVSLGEHEAAIADVEKALEIGGLRDEGEALARRLLAEARQALAAADGE